MALFFLEVQHHPCQLLRAHFLEVLREMADIIVLTKTTFKITGCKKDCSGTVSSGNGIFLSKMSCIAGNSGVSTGRADALFSFISIDSAVSRAKITVFKDLMCLFDTLLQLSICKKLYASGSHGRNIVLSGFSFVDYFLSYTWIIATCFDTI